MSNSGKPVSRRGFLGTAAVGLGGVALAGMVSGCDTVDPALEGGGATASYDALVAQFRLKSTDVCPFCGDHPR